MLSIYYYLITSNDRDQIPELNDQARAKASISARETALLLVIAAKRGLGMPVREVSQE